MRVNLGSGPRATPGWVCFDRSPNLAISRVPLLKPALGKLGLLNSGHLDSWDREVRRADIRKRLPLADASVEAVYTSHVLEHLYLSDVRVVLAEAARILEPGGIIRINVPDALRNAQQLVDGVSDGHPDPGAAFNSYLLAYPEQRPTPMQSIRRAIGGHIHKWQPTRSQLRRLLTEAGFTDISDHEFKEGELPDLDTIETRTDSLYMEARKPR